MYKCSNCGNMEKFEGFAEEKGNAFIYQDSNCHDNYSRYTWIFKVSDRSWKSSFKVLRCSKCNSVNIHEI